MEQAWWLGVSGRGASVGGFHQGLHRGDAGAGAHGGGGHDRVVPTRPRGYGHGFAKFLEVAVTLRTLFRDQELKGLVELLGVVEGGREGHLHRDLVVPGSGLLTERLVHLIDHRIFHGVQELEVFADGHVEGSHAVCEVEQDFQELQEGFPFLLASDLARDVGGVPLEQRHGLPRDHQHQLTHDPGFALEFWGEPFLRSVRGADRPVGEASATCRAGDLEDLAGGNAELLPALGVHAGDDLRGVGGLHHAVPRPDVFPSSFDNCSTNFAPTMAVTRFMCSDSSSHSAGIRSFLSCGWTPHLALTISPSRVTSTLINWMLLGALSCAPGGGGDPGTRSAMACSFAMEAYQRRPYDTRIIRRFASAAAQLKLRKSCARVSPSSKAGESRSSLPSIRR